MTKNFADFSFVFDPKNTTDLGPEIGPETTPDSALKEAAAGKRIGVL
jgi:hypothetical protein